MTIGELLKENRKKLNLTQKEMIERISVSRATVQRLIKKLVIENKVERIGGKRYAIGGLMNNVCDGK